MRLVIISDFKCHYNIDFPSLKAALQESDIIVWADQTDLRVEILAYAHLVITFSLLMVIFVFEEI